MSPAQTSNSKRKVLKQKRAKTFANIAVEPSIKISVVAESEFKSLKKKMRAHYSNC